jgi:hypothetical protein
MGAVGQLLGLPRLTVWWWVKTGQLTPTGVDGGQPWWSETDVYEWALSRPGEKWSGRVPVWAWPEMPLNTVYDTAVELPGAVALRWRTRQGPVHVIWPLPQEPRRASHQEWVRQLAPCGEGAMVVVSGGFSPRRGPVLPQPRERGVPPVTSSIQPDQLSDCRYR